MSMKDLLIQGMEELPNKAGSIDDILNSVVSYVER